MLTATVDGVDLVAVGWKQNLESDLFFIMTRGEVSAFRAKKAKKAKRAHNRKRLEPLDRRVRGETRS